MIANAKNALQELEAFIRSHCRCPKSSYDISGVKSTGEVTVRLKSSQYVSAFELADRLYEALESRGLLFAQFDGIKFSISLEQFDVERRDPV